MELLYSNILPLGTEDGQETLIDCFNEQISKADRVEIAVGYTSAASISVNLLISNLRISSW